MVNFIKAGDGTLLPFVRMLLTLSTLGFDEEEMARALAAWRYDLSHTEVRVLEHLTCGITDSEIAERMGVAEENTVKNCLKAIYKKMGVRNRTQAATIAVHYGFGPKSPYSRRSNE
jgi:DNA-binding NarL/FixJ family response regulator